MLSECLITRLAGELFVLTGFNKTVPPQTRPVLTVTMATQEKSGTQSSQPDPPVEMIDLIDYVKDMTPKWMAIGIKLGQAKIVRLVQNDSSISDKCLEFLIKWHDKGEGVSWSNLVDVLSDDKIQLGRVATKIKKVRSCIDIF